MGYSFQNIIRAATLGAGTAFILSACGGAQPGPVESVCVWPDAQEKRAPDWVCGAPYKNARYSAMGSHKSKNTQLARNMAVADAKKNMASSMREHVRRMVKTYTEATGSGDQETIDTVMVDISTHLTDETLFGVRTLWTQPSPTGVMYAVVGMDDSDGMKATKEALKTSYNNRKAEWQRLMQTKRDDEMNKELDRMVQQNNGPVSPNGSQ